VLAHSCLSCAAKARKIVELERLLEGAVYTTKREAARLVRTLGITEQQAEILTVLYRSGHDFVTALVIIDALPPARRGERTEGNRDGLAKVQVTRLRKHLGSDAIETAWGAGYRLGAAMRKRVAEILEVK
jgi:DNA-binding response OmpR family regulator